MDMKILGWSWSIPSDTDLANMYSEEKKFRISFIFNIKVSLINTHHVFYIVLYCSFFFSLFTEIISVLCINNMVYLSG